MKLAVAVLTYNRQELFLRTLHSIQEGLCQAWAIEHDLTVVDNGSTDGTAELVRGLEGGYANVDGNRTVGHGMNLAITRALASKPDLVLFTADDYEYKPGWASKLARFWWWAPPEVALVCCNLEPDYDWNRPHQVVASAGILGLARESLPGSNWCFRASEWPLIGPLAETTGGEDLAVCRRLRRPGRLLCALDLSEHIGERQSAWGNGSWRYARLLDRGAWGI